MPKTVYIVNLASFDYTPAKEFGELVFMTKGYKDMKEVEEIKTILKSLIETATPDDYLLLSGNNLLCVIAFDLWKSIHKTVNILHWSNGKYDGYTL